MTKDPNFFQTLATGVAAPEKTLEASDDGQASARSSSLSGGGAPEHTMSFAPVTAKYFRVTFKPRRPLPSQHGPRESIRFFGAGAPAAGLHPMRLRSWFSTPSPRVNHFEEKAAFVPEGDLYQYATPEVDPAAAIRKSDVIDLTSKMRPDGTLDWTPPEGHWVVLRFGYSLLGITNHPATPEATGLEVDKLDRALREGLLRQVSRQLQGDGRRRHDGQDGHPLRDQRQLGGRVAELDRQHDRAVQEAAAATTRRPGCRC